MMGLSLLFSLDSDTDEVPCGCLSFSRIPIMLCAARKHGVGGISEGGVLGQITAPTPTTCRVAPEGLALCQGQYSQSMPPQPQGDAKL